MQVIEKQALSRTWNKEVFPPDYFRYFHQVIIYNRSQFVSGKSIFSPNQKIWKILPIPCLGKESYSKQQNSGMHHYFTQREG